MNGRMFATADDAWPAPPQRGQPRRGPAVRHHRAGVVMGWALAGAGCGVLTVGITVFTYGLGVILAFGALPLAFLLKRITGRNTTFAWTLIGYPIAFLIWLALGKATGGFDHQPLWMPMTVGATWAVIAGLGVLGEPHPVVRLARLAVVGALAGAVASLAGGGVILAAPIAWGAVVAATLAYGGTSAPRRELVLRRQTASI
jgi:hypothetical protein